MIVSTNPKVVEMFFKQNISQVSNPQQSLWYNNKELYSYRSLLARIDATNKVLFIDEYIRSYSNTTAKHTALIIREASYRDCKILSIPLTDSTEQVLKFYSDKIFGLLDKYKRTRKHKEFYKVRIKAYIKDSEDYAKYSGIKDYKVDTTLMQELFKLCIL